MVRFRKIKRRTKQLGRDIKELGPGQIKEKGQIIKRTTKRNIGKAREQIKKSEPKVKAGLKSMGQKLKEMSKGTGKSDTSFGFGSSDIGLGLGFAGSTKKRTRKKKRKRKSKRKPYKKKVTYFTMDL